MIGVLAEGRRPAVPAGGVGIPAARATRLHNLVELATQMAERTAQGLTAAQESLDRGVLSVTSRRQAERFRATDRGVVDIVVGVAHARASTKEGGSCTRHAIAARSSTGAQLADMLRPPPSGSQRDTAPHR